MPLVHAAAGACRGGIAFRWPVLVAMCVVVDYPLHSVGAKRVECRSNQENKWLAPALE